MYTIHVKIKDTCKHNGDIAQTLELITHYKKIFQARIASISQKMTFRTQPSHADHFEAQAIEFYDALITKISHINQEP